MGSINLGGLQSSTRPDYLYRDIELDLQGGNVPSRTNLYKKEDSTDVRASFDEGAIKNSIKNIFNTVPGQKLLNPQFGLDLHRFLFMPLTPDTAEIIGETVLEGIRAYEPRVTIDNVTVNVDYDNSEYSISLTLTIPQLSILQKRYSGVLQQAGYTFI